MSNSNPKLSHKTVYREEATVHKTSSPLVQNDRSGIKTQRETDVKASVYESSTIISTKDPVSIPKTPLSYLSIQGLSGLA